MHVAPLSVIGRGSLFCVLGGVQRKVKMDIGIRHFPNPEHIGPIIKRVMEELVCRCLLLVRKEQSPSKKKVAACRRILLPLT